MRSPFFNEFAVTNHPEKTIKDEYYLKNITSYYGENVFNDEAMRRYLPYRVYERLQKIIETGEPIDDATAEGVAHGMKEWARDNGVTYYTHWFQPLTGLTAEKHDSFLSFDSIGKPIERFSASNLKQGEPDASSFPSGGLRSTFEARGYTAWDPTSPAFIVENANGKTLCIPTIFLSYTGDVLDKKLPLIRSAQKLSEAAVNLLKLFNKDIKWVSTTVGPEQEYFLIDKFYANNRPDILITGRTLFGALPPKGQQMEDHYFGSIKPRVLAFMQEVEVELYKLGVPAKTRHNEVAPAQFEIAQIFENYNLANDHNQIVMETLRKVAEKHNFYLLLHEKPFAGVNGSGKHNNWSMVDSNGKNLLAPGYSSLEQLEFLTFLVSVLKGVYKHGDLLRASVASAGNDHRLGANEAPPAIMSVFLGNELTKILDHIENNREMLFTNKEKIDLGIPNFPLISKDSTDRNRTSPFAFTGNKFEFRAVGSSQSIARANMVINAIVADAIIDITEKIKQNLEKNNDIFEAVIDVLIDEIKLTKPIRFEGNNYSKEWHEEASKRGLPNLKNTPEALKVFVADKNKELLSKLGILREHELEALYTVHLETYVKTIEIEAETALGIAKTQILPSVVKYQNQLLDNLKLSKDLAFNVQTKYEYVEKYSKLVDELIIDIDSLEEELEKVEQIDDEQAKAEALAEKILNEKMAKLRKTVDTLETLTDSTIWPLPKYNEMLFIY